LNNPGFDGTLNGWSAQIGSPVSSYTSLDSEACGGSGSVYLDTPYMDGDPYQCFSLRGNGSGTYNFGAKFRYLEPYMDAFCTLIFYNDANCTVQNGVSDHLGPDMNNSDQAPNWQSYAITVPAPAGVVAASVQCAYNNNSYGMWIDQIYVNKSANSF